MTAQQPLYQPRHTCSWCGLQDATTDRYGHSCDDCAAATPSERASRYLAYLGRLSESGR